jgi:hypothetical protein
VNLFFSGSAARDDDTEQDTRWPVQLAGSAWDAEETTVSRVTMAAR